MLQYKSSIDVSSDCVTFAACLVILLRDFLSFSFMDDHHKLML